MPSLSAAQILKRLDTLSHPSRLEGKNHWNVTGAHMIGVSVPDLRTLAKEIGRNHTLAAELWTSVIHEARILASMIDDPALVTPAQMNQWVADFDSWDICDQVCGNLFDKTPYAYSKITEWAEDEREFVRRSAFTLMATLAVHDKSACDAQFVALFPLINRYATDERNFVKKAVNWAIRQIGKRNATLHPIMLATAEALATAENASARWIGKDAVRELKSDAVLKRVARLRF